MKVGDRIKYTPWGRIDTYKGSVLHFTVWWAKIEWEDRSNALVLEGYLEVINE